MAPDTSTAELAQVEELFFAALELSPEGRRALLAQYPAPVCQEVEALLLEDQRGSVVQRAIRGAAGSLVEASLAPGWASIERGTRLGPWEVEEEIGSGGMGSVYLAARADETYHRKVAIKFVRREFDTALFRQRFEQERRILGRLDHPYIARLLDAGSTPAGQPYFVMEYVAGAQSICAYARSTNLNRAGRIALFGKVCEAVQYAHQNLTVHRDLKPGNILIDPTGTPKLLDFGIAKLTGVEGTSTEQTVAAGLRMLTPDYASPEHAAGLPVATTADIYSVGAILYELLLEEKPPRLADDQEEIDPPHSLGADLGGILRKAMHRDPARRYATANGLRDDLDRYLTGTPILARSYSLPERAMYFGRRYATFLLASALVAGGLAVAAIVAVQAAETAEQARQEAVRERNSADEARVQALRHSEESARMRNKAEEERNIARERSTETVELTGQLIRDLQDKIEGLPGAGPARLESITIAIQYLERLARDRDSGPKTQRDLALAYMRLADLRGGGGSMNNQGDLKAAQVLLEKAEGILRGRGAAGEESAAKPYMLKLLARQVEIRDLLGDPTGSDRAMQEGLGIARSGMDYAKGLEDGIIGLYVSGIKAALRRVDHQKGLAYSLECQRVAKLAPQSLESRDELASCLIFEGRVIGGQGELVRAVELLRQGIAIREEVLLHRPANSTARKQLMLAYSHLSAFLGSPSRANLGDTAGALLAMEKVREHAVWNARSDPGDMSAQKDLAISSSRYGDLLLGARRYEQSATQLGEAVELFSSYLKRMPGDLQILSELVFAAKRQGDALSQLDPTIGPPVLAAYRKGLVAADEIEQNQPKSLSVSGYVSNVMLRMRMAQLLTKQYPAEAEFQVTRALTLSKAAIAAHPQAKQVLVAREQTVLKDAAVVFDTLGRTDRAAQCRAALTQVSRP